MLNVTVLSKWSLPSYFLCACVSLILHYCHLQMPVSFRLHNALEIHELLLGSYFDQQNYSLKRYIV
uniref:Uncharacterized protein n=1 Tax=Arundo donax TaxID=35708 RepID=A0A0A9BLB9_ARUDO